MDKMFKKMLKRFEDLAERSQKAEDRECEFNCLNVIMGINSNLEQEKINEQYRQESLKAQIKERMQSMNTVVAEKTADETAE